ncbi:hypothetical protein [Gordonia malaquae]|uniref:hypothetical protein n=1 Tax=Gordonia malaquae TaxID=410332 RepID=UPI003016B17B
MATKTVNLPISLASRKGVPALAKLSEANRVALTSHGRVVAVVDSPSRADDQARDITEAKRAVLEAAADLVAQRPPRHTLDELCERIGLDADRVRRRATEISTNAGSDSLPTAINRQG